MLRACALAPVFLLTGLAAAANLLTVENPGPDYWYVTLAPKQAGRALPACELWVSPGQTRYFYATSPDCGSVNCVLQIQSRPLGDVNGDAVVDGADLLLVIEDFGTRAGRSDLNGDGIVDVSDLLLLSISGAG